ncbi:MAG: hypothetical protein EOM61_07865 [Bacteroidia bacterium]|nr:hypothetical protein [Bacteroidia bacterium]
MKIILFITTPSETSLEKNLWKWEDGNGVPCTVLSFPSPADADGQWLVKTFKVLGCSELHDNAAWNYENLGKLVRDNAGNGECAVFMHTDSTRLQNLINKFTADSEKKNIVFIEYSSIYDRPYKTHINPFADEPNSTNFYSLWNAIVVEKKKENTVEQLCQWRYDLIVPLVAWDLLHKCNNVGEKNDSFDQCRDSIKKKVSLTSVDTSLDKLEKHLEGINYISTAELVFSIYSAYKKIDDAKEIEENKLSIIVSQFNQAIAGVKEVAESA